LNEIGQGLTLSGFGILITFSTLGVLILLIALLKKLFPSRKSAPSGKAPQGKELNRDLRRKKAAAAAVAALLLQSREQPGSDLGTLLESPPGNWWRKALDRIHAKE
jgi:hypothetical protein